MIKKFQQPGTFSNSGTPTLIEAKGVSKSYKQGDGELVILRNIDLQIKVGESLSIVGPSGAGKSTLLHILSTLDRPTGGQVFYEGNDLGPFTDDQLAEFRGQTMGFVFQFHHLLSEFSAIENVMLPARISGESKESAREKALPLMALIGLRDRVDHFPNQLSGGELQRVAIARALIRKPKILFADEPTGNLDQKTSLAIQKLFFELKAQYGLTLVVVTHDQNFASKFSKVLRISDGRWENQSPLSF